MNENEGMLCPDSVKLSVEWNDSINEVIKETVDVKKLFIFFLDHPNGSSDRFFWTTYKTCDRKQISVSHKATNWTMRIFLRIDNDLKPALDAVSALAKGDTNNEKLYIDWLVYDLFYIGRIENGTC